MIEIHKVISSEDAGERVQVTFLYEQRVGTKHRAVIKRSGTMHLRKQVEGYLGWDPFVEGKPIFFTDKQVFGK